MGRVRQHGVRRGEKSWAKIVRQFESSGLSQHAFCQREGLALSSLQRWRQRIHPKGKAEFVELVPTEAAPIPLSSRWSLELTLANGTSFRFQG